MKKTLLLLLTAFVFSPNIAFSGWNGGGYGGGNRGHRGFSYGYQQPAQINQYIYDDCDDDYNNGYRPQVYNNNYYVAPTPQYVPRTYYAPQPIVQRNYYYGQPNFQPAFQPAFQPNFQPNLVPIYPRNSINVQFGF